MANSGSITLTCGWTNVVGISLPNPQELFDRDVNGILWYDIALETMNNTDFTITNGASEHRRNLIQ